jgi:methyl-accepting chemotaxis protein
VEMRRVYGRLEGFIGLLNGMLEQISELSTRIDMVVSLTERDLALNEVARKSLGGLLTEVNRILIASSEQKSALEEIAGSVAVINGTTQKVAMGAQDLSITSRELAVTAQQLMGLSEEA